MVRWPTGWRALSLAAGMAALGLAAPARDRGVVLHAVTAGTPPAASGLQPGDRLLSWRRSEGAEPGRGRLVGASEWTAFLDEQPPRGALELRGTRDGRRMRWTVPAGAWRLSATPSLAADLWARVLEARAAAAAGDHPREADLWRGLARELAARGDGALAALLEHREAYAWERAGDREACDAALSRALARVGATGERRLRVSLLKGRAQILDGRADPGAPAAWGEAVAAAEPLGPCLALADLLNRQSWALELSGDLGAARAAGEASLALYGSLAPRCPLTSRVQLNLSRVAWKRGDTAAFGGLVDGAVTALEAVEPEGATMGDALVMRGLFRFDGGLLEGAESDFRRAAALARQNGGDAVAPLANVAMVLETRGELAAAEALLQEALGLAEGDAAGASRTAGVLNLLGITQFEQGALAEAEATLGRCLEIRLRQSPRDVETAKARINLANTLVKRGRLAEGEAHMEAAVALLEALAPQSLSMAEALSNLGTAYLDSGLLPEGEALLERSNALLAAHFPDSPDRPLGLVMLGHARLGRGDAAGAAALAREAQALAASQEKGLQVLVETAQLLSAALAAQGRGDEAEAESRTALALLERLSPDATAAGSLRMGLASLLSERGDLEEAEALLRRSLEVQRARAPEGALAVDLLHQLGLVLWSQGRREDSLAALREAADRAESLAGRAPGSGERRGEFLRRYLGLYQDLQERLVEAGLGAEAFAVLERSRAQGLLAMLAERDLAFARDLPAELDRERREARAAVREVLEAQEAATDGDSARAAEARLTEARTRAAAVAERVRRASPRLAELEAPRTLDLGGARAVLEPGTLLLAFACGEAQTLLYAVGPGPSEFAVHRIPAGREALGRLVRRLRTSLAEGQGAGRATEELSAALLAPARGPLSRARSLLICPDGPLHGLPFAALPDPAGARKGRALVERLPLRVALSATLYGQLRGSAGGGGSCAVFADPAYPGTSEAPPGLVRAAARRGLPLSPLPHTRLEAEALARLRPGAEVWTGGDATEGRARALFGSYAVVHFACHGFADPDHPLDSALLMAVPGPEAPAEADGLLQAWEVFEGMRLRADLVVLSACETGMGREAGGEGLVGLSRAFQYAGARAVLASLWPVQDRATAGLMGRFHAHLAAGAPADEALRRAQVELRREGEPPFAWAGFVLLGPPAR